MAVTTGLINPPSPIFFKIKSLISIVRKVGHRRIRRTVANYFGMRRSRKPVPKGLAEAGQSLVRELGKGVSTPEVAKDLGIYTRHVQRLWARLQKTGTHGCVMNAGIPMPCDIRTGMT